MRYQRQILPVSSGTTLIRPGSARPVFTGPGPLRAPTPSDPRLRPRGFRGLGYSGVPGVNSYADPALTLTTPGVAVPGAAGANLTLNSNDPRLQDLSFADKAQSLSYQDYIGQTGIEDNQGDPYGGTLPEWSDATRTPLSPGIDTAGYENPFRTVMYSITGLSTTIPSRVLTGNLRRTYLIIQNLGPGNMYVGIGTDPNAGGSNVLNLVSTQVYEQIGGGFFLPPNPWFPDGVSIASSFVSPEYISLMVDTAGTNAMILEGTWSPPRAGANVLAGGGGTS